jgi:hypothetical protein
MAIQVKTAAKGDASATGMPRQPRPAAPDETVVRNPTKAGHGMNGDTNGSSAPIGKIVSPLGLNLRASVEDSAIEDVIANGMGRKANYDSASKLTGQERTISDEAFPAAHGQVSRQANSGSPGGTIPPTIGASSAPLPKKPGA